MKQQMVVGLEARVTTYVGDYSLQPEIAGNKLHANKSVRWYKQTTINKMNDLDTF